MKNHPLRPPYTRNRNKNTVVVIGGQVDGYQISNGVRTELQHSARNSVVTNQDVMSDVVTPGYQQLISSGQIVSRPMSQVKTEYSCSDTGIKLQSTSGGTTAYWEDSANIMHFYFGTPSVGTLNIDVENLIRFSNTKALAGAKSSNFMGMVTLAESAKTARMLISPLSATRKLIEYVADQRAHKKSLRIDSTLNGEVRINGRVFHKAFGRGVHVGPGRVIRPKYKNIVIPLGEAVSGTVLMNNLGLRPLMMDIDFITKGIRNLHKEERQTSRASEQDQASTTSSQDVSYGAAKFTIETTQTSKVSVRSFVSWFDKFDVLQDHGLSLFDVPSAAYELIPYSFVLDYFINLGPLIEAHRAYFTQKFYNGGHTILIDNQVSRSFLGAVGTSGWTVTRAPTGGDSLRVLTKTRSIQFPEAGLAYKPLGRIFRPTVVQNLISLTAQSLIRLDKSNRGTKATFY